MKFEIINRENKAVMYTHSISCIPDKNLLTYMSKAGYKFKIDGKATSVKMILEQLAIKGV